MKFVQIEKRGKLSRAELAELFAHLNEAAWEGTLDEGIPFGKLSGKISRNFLTPTDTPIPECLSCGACCVLLFDVQLTSNDLMPPENYWDVPADGADGEIIVNRVLRRDSQTGRCLSLKGEIGRDIKCDVYEQRPESCRLFEAGSDKCHALRRAVRIEPLLAPHESFNALVKILDRDEPQNSDLLRILECEITGGGTGEKLSITVETEDHQTLVIHEFDPKKERWLEGDFIGSTLASAGQLVASPPVRDGDKEANPAADSFI